MTYAGHTVWGVEADVPAGVKRRPRSEWLVQRDTHDALITDAEAEAVLVQVERAVQGRRTRESPLLLSGLLRAPDGEPWHSDGCGFYRHGKRGRRLAATSVEGAVLDRVLADLSAEESVQRLHGEMTRIAFGEHIDGRRVAGLERRMTT